MIEDLEHIKKQIPVEELKNSKTLLIGSNGFLGRWFFDLFQHIGAEVVCIDNDSAPSDSKANYLKYDICQTIELEEHFDYIINCAGIASPEKYMKLPIETLDVSYIGTKNVLDFARKNGTKSILLFSSSEVYGTPHPDFIPTKEDYIGSIPTMGNRSCYDIGKQVLETLSHIYFNEYNSPVKVLRPFNLYGPHMGTKDNRVLSNWMNNALDGKSIKVYGDGGQTRTFCYAADGIAMALGVLLKGENGQVYNIGTNTPELNMRELASKFLEGIEKKGLLGLGKKIEVDMISYPSDYPSDEPLRRCPNIDKTVRATNIQPSTSLVQGIGKMFEYFKNQR
tara:strand:+ start:1694 stop:2704 length:1011 start_codon:yes stop_codon:yes gene_type:complete